jgi:hypothetical protein
MAILRWAKLVGKTMRVLGMRAQMMRIMTAHKPRTQRLQQLQQLL